MSSETSPTEFLFGAILFSEDVPWLGRFRRECFSDGCSDDLFYLMQVFHLSYQAAGPPRDQVDGGFSAEYAFIYISLIAKWIKSETQTVCLCRRQFGSFWPE